MTRKWHEIAGKWKRISGDIKNLWGVLTHDERMKRNGRREILAGSIQERFGVTPLKARKQGNKGAESQDTYSILPTKESFSMMNKSDSLNTLVENQQLRAALAHMSEAELKRLLNSIGALQIDLSRFVTLLNGADPIQAVTATQDLLKVLTIEINGIIAFNQMKDSQGRLQDWDNEGGQFNYAPIYHLLRKVSGKGGLIWTDVGHIRR
jgi:uncharacterized protein YjbJ (UPF0337 family)